MRRVILLLMLVLVLPFSTSCSESVHTKKVSEATGTILNEKLLMRMVLEIVKKGRNPESVKNYLSGKSIRYKLVASQRQGEMMVDGYSVPDIKSPIIGYSLFFHKRSGNLAIVDASVNPLNQTAMEAVSQLVNKSLDSVDATGKSKIYFLGIFDIGNQRVLKIMVREAQISQDKEYAIRYVVSLK